MTAIPEIDLARIARWCEARVPPQVRDQVRIEFTTRGSSVNVLERRAPFAPDRDPAWTSTRIAQLRHDAGSNGWSLYFRDRNDVVHDYRDAAPVGTRLIDVLAELDADPTAIFWG